jgi:hypothetical protein
MAVYIHIIINITYIYTIYVCLFIRYLVFITQALNDTQFGLDKWCESGNLLLFTSDQPCLHSSAIPTLKYFSSIYVCCTKLWLKIIYYVHKHLHVLLIKYRFYH